jgi:magnesium-transporting ATPase (P-type)
VVLSRGRQQDAAQQRAERNVDAAFAELGSSGAGLSHAEAARRLGQYGPNTLPPAARRRWYVELGASFIHMFALPLWAGAILAWIAGMPGLAWAIVAVIVINGLFRYWQEYQAERAPSGVWSYHVPRDSRLWAKKRSRILR